MKRISIFIILITSLVLGACGKVANNESTVPKKVPAGEITADAEWKEAYAQLMLGTFREMNAGAMYYEEGTGRFALKDMNGDDIPELFIIAEDDTSLVYTYDEEQKEAVSVRFADGGTDVVYLEFGCLRFGNDGTFIEDCGTIFNYWVIPENQENDYAVKFYACTYGEIYVCNEFDVERICREGFDYRMGFTDNEVTKDEFDEYIEKYDYKDGEYTVVSEDEIYMITDADVNKVLR